MSGDPNHASALRLRGWCPLVAVFIAAPVLLVGVPGVRDAWPAWCWAWGLTFSLFGAMKWLTWRRASTPQISPWLQLGYLFAWPGLDARAFFHGKTAHDEPIDPRVGVVAIGKMFLGAAFFWGAARLVPDDFPFVRAWFGLAGLAIGVLGGLIHFLSWLWRAAGVDAVPIMNRPLRSVSLADFWGRRWNLAFHDFALRFIHRPLAVPFGRGPATLGVFLFSGLLHDTVVSLPAGGCYGGPTLYFLIQIVGLVVERFAPFARLAARRPLVGRAFAAVVLVGPVGSLFHRPFVERVWLPFMHAVGAL